MVLIIGPSGLKIFLVQYSWDINQIMRGLHELISLADSGLSTTTDVILAADLAYLTPLSIPDVSGTGAVSLLSTLLAYCCLMSNF